MFNSTFFKFLITFAVIIGVSFLIMGITGSFGSKINADKNIQQIIVK
jgi:hypothetical protein